MIIQWFPHCELPNWKLLKTSTSHICFLEAEANFEKCLKSYNLAGIKWKPIKQHEERDVLFSPRRLFLLFWEVMSQSWGAEAGNVQKKWGRTRQDGKMWRKSCPSIAWGLTFVSFWPGGVHLCSLNQLDQLTWPFFLHSKTSSPVCRRATQTDSITLFDMV